jgi:hypothetical protein
VVTTRIGSPAGTVRSSSCSTRSRPTAERPVEKDRPEPGPRRVRWRSAGRNMKKSPVAEGGLRAIIRGSFPKRADQALRVCRAGEEFCLAAKPHWPLLLNDRVPAVGTGLDPDHCRKHLHGSGLLPPIEANYSSSLTLTSIPRAQGQLGKLNRGFRTAPKLVENSRAVRDGLFFCGALFGSGVGTVGFDLWALPPDASESAHIALDVEPSSAKFIPQFKPTADLYQRCHGPADRA